MISVEQFSGMRKLAETDEGMKNLLEKAKLYYILHGEPPGPKIHLEETPEQARWRIMNTVYR